MGDYFPLVRFRKMKGKGFAPNSEFRGFEKSEVVEYCQAIDRGEDED